MELQKWILKAEGILGIKIAGVTVGEIIMGGIVFLLFLLFRRHLARWILEGLKKIVVTTSTKIDDKLFQAGQAPLRFLFSIFGFFMFLTITGFLNDFTYGVIKSGIIFDLSWFLYNITREFEEEIHHFMGKVSKTSRELVSFLIKGGRVLIILLGGVAVLQEWGVNVTGFIASLGLGGLAFALAAKDTAANIFGGIAILTDNIFKIGEWIKVGEAEGIVEDIGIRTTKIRAFDKRLIIVPNAKIANSNVENFSRRDRRRVVMRIGLTYSTTKEQMEQILGRLREYLLSHPMVHNDPLLVYFDQFEDSSLSIFCYFFISTADWEEYLKIREEINLAIKGIVEEAGAEFAFPSQSLYLETPVITAPIHSKEKTSKFNQSLPK